MATSDVLDGQESGSIVTPRGKAGRPPYDPLATFLFVEAERRKLGLSVNKFCAGHALLLMHVRNEDKRWPTLSKSTLRRRYTEARKNLLESFPEWKKRCLPQPLEEMVQEFMGEPVLGLFPLN